MSSSMSRDLDVNAVHQTINKHQEAMASLDAEIELLVRNIRQLQYQKQRHADEIRHCKGRITLARRLPPEILASIFEECIQDGWTRTPLVVSHVCSSWRNAAKIPTVWSHVYVDFDARDPYTRTRFWFEKSQNSPLTIELEVGHDMSHIDHMVELLLSTLPRWKTLNIKSVMLHPVNQILGACNQKLAPQLQTVDISVAEEFAAGANENDERELIALRTSFLEAPNFQDLRIRRNILPRSGILPSFITSLSIQHPTYHTQPLSSLVQLLDELPNLHSFLLQVTNGELQQFELNVPSDRMVELPHLLTMTLMGRETVFALLPHLKVPSLRHLFLQSSLDYYQPSDIVIWIENFLQHSSAPITVLEIRDLGLPPLAHDRILRMLPSLEELRLHDCDLVDSTLHAMTEQGVCPRLKKLDLRWCGRISGRALVEFVRSRSAPNNIEDSADVCSSVAVAEITLISCSFVKEEDIMELAQMTVCRLVHNGQGDLCYTLGCCENQRYRRRLKQRNPQLSLSNRQTQVYRRLIF